MAAVNRTRDSIALDMNNALANSRIVAHNGDGLVAIWYGGYNIEVYDAAREWQSVKSMTSGDLAQMADKNTDEAREAARRRMAEDGFESEL